jgi:radical SAM superfamily enzyme YgiQ (UPF0313 family)
MGEVRVRFLLLSCYELGHPPQALAAAAGALRAAGAEVDVQDLAVESLDEARVAAADWVAISTPMHTALRLGAETARRVRAVAPGVRVAFFGLYAGLNATALGAEADAIIGAESEDALCALARGEPLPDPGRPARAARRLPLAPRAHELLPPLQRYARAVIGGVERPAGYVEASSGCLHHCRHCPLPPAYGGRFYVNPVAEVMADVAAQVERGAEHVTFGDPDFLNGPGHARAVARAMREQFGGVTWDITAKIEHLIRHAELLPELAQSGCVFVVSAVESLSDRVLAILDKGHTRADVARALELARGAGLPLRPSLVMFTPWSTLEDYRDVLTWIEREELTDHVDPVQLTIRLLVPPGSLLEDHPAMRPHLRELIPQAFAWRWTHPDARMDALYAEVFRAVAAGGGFDEVCALAGQPRERRAPPAGRRQVPHLTEPWFC